MLLKPLLAGISILLIYTACIGIQPILSTDISPSGLVFPEEAESALAKISNAGGGTLAWTANLSEFKRDNSSHSAWVELLTSSGQLGQAQDQMIGLKRQIMPAGNYSALLTITYQYNGAPVSEQFQVKANVIDRPSIKIDSPFSSLDVAAGQTSFYVQNGSFNDKVLNWSLIIYRTGLLLTKRVVL